MLAIDVGDAFLYRADGTLDLTGAERPWTGPPGSASAPPTVGSRTVSAEFLYAIPVRHAVGHYVAGRLTLPLDEVASLIASYATGTRQLPRLEVLALLERYLADYRDAQARHHSLPGTLPDGRFSTPDGLQEKLARRLKQAFPDRTLSSGAT